MDRTYLNLNKFAEELDTLLLSTNNSKGATPVSLLNAIRARGKAWPRRRRRVTLSLHTVFALTTTAVHEFGIFPTHLDGRSITEDG